VVVTDEKGNLLYVNTIGLGRNTRHFGKDDDTKQKWMYEFYEKFPDPEQRRKYLKENPNGKKKWIREQMGEKLTPYQLFTVQVCTAINKSNDWKKLFKDAPKGTRMRVISYLYTNYVLPTVFSEVKNYNFNMDPNEVKKQRAFKDLLAKRISTMWPAINNLIYANLTEAYHQIVYAHWRSASAYTEDGKLKPKQKYRMAGGNVGVWDKNDYTIRPTGDTGKPFDDGQGWLYDFSTPKKKHRTFATGPQVSEFGTEVKYMSPSSDSMAPRFPTTFKKQ
jgi:hypothetical protein